MLTGTLIFVAVGATLALVSAIAYKAMAEISWHELEEYCRIHERERTFEQIHDEYDTTIAVTEMLQILGTIVCLIALTANARADVLGSMAYALSLILVSTLAATLVTVWLPREIAHHWGAAYLARTWPCWRLVNRLLKPIQLPATWFRVITRRLDGRDKDWSEEEALEDEILSIVTEGQHDGLLEDDVREMIAGVIELDDTDVADIMTPRSDMDAIPLDLDWAEMLQFVVRVGRTRIPVYDKNLDDVVGLLYVKDLLAVLSSDATESPQLKDIIREVSRVPRSTRLDELLQNFLNTRSHLAIVVDEFLHVVGLVTIEDVLEEIVGEIVDETDQEEPNDIRWVSENAAEIFGRAHLEDVNEALGVQLPISGEYDTVGGFILHELGRIPQKGERLDWQDISITVQEATRRRIELVLMEFKLKPKVLNAN